MRIEDLQLALRPRNGFQAADLGMALVRANARVIWLSWLAVVLPLTAVLNLLFWRLDALWLAGLLLWWLKPVFERIPLYVISRAAFGQRVGIAQTLRAQAGFGLASLPGYLLWRRLGLARSLMMPVDMLEGGSRQLRQSRRRALLNDYGMAAVVTWLMLHFELVLVVGIIALSGLMVPPEMLGDTLRELWEILRHGNNDYSTLAVNLLSAVALCVIGPLYVGAGFGLYLNARTRREGWDLELGLRQLGQRLRKAAPLVLLVLLASPGLLPGNLAPAQAATTTGQAQQQAFAQAVEQAYAHPDLGQQRQRVERKEKQASAKNKQQHNSEDSRLFANIVAALATGGSLLLWALLIALVLALLFSARYWLPWLRWRSKPRMPASAIEQHALALPDTLPDDIASQARLLWQQGHGRQAMALLYRASVAAMARLSQQVLPPGATEAQCLRAARALGDGSQQTLFADVVRHWQATAYAGRLPDDAGFEQLLARLRQQPGWLQ